MPFLPAIPAGLAVAATAASAAATGAAAIFAYQGQKASANYSQQAYAQQAAFQKQLGERNAALVDIEGAAAEDALQRDRRRRLAALQAGMAGSGIQSGVGSPLDLYADNFAQASRDVRNLRYTTAVQRQNAILGGEISSRNEMLNSIGAQVAGQQAFGSLIGGFGQAAGIGAGVLS
jgi:hypothetical protein